MAEVGSHLEILLKVLACPVLTSVLLVCTHWSEDGKGGCRSGQKQKFRATFVSLGDSCRFLWPVTFYCIHGILVISKLFLDIIV